MTLAECRNRWENKDKVFLEMPFMRDSYPKLLVVVHSRSGYYRLHRYFPIGGNWEVSVDINDTKDLASIMEHIREDRDVVELMKQVSEYSCILPIPTRV